MKAYFKKIAALTAAALLVLSMAACGGNDDEEPTESDTVNAIVDEVTPGDTSASEDASADASENASEGASEDGTEAANNGDTNDTQASAPSANATSLSKEEAVALFNKATANAKSMKGNRYTSVELVEIPGGSVLKSALSPLLPDPNEAAPLTGVANKTMQASDFSSVTAKKSGNNWVLTMTVKTETAPNTPANSRAFAVLPQSEIDSALGSLNATPADAIKFVYTGGTIVATVSADGSKLVSATYTMKVQLVATNAKALGGLVKIDSAKVNISQVDKF